MRLRTRGSVSVRPRAFSSGVSSDGTMSSSQQWMPGIGKMSGDAGTHGSGAEYGDFYRWLAGAGCHKIGANSLGLSDSEAGR